MVIGFLLCSLLIAVDDKLEPRQFVVRRGTVQHVDFPSQMLKVQNATEAQMGYLFIHPYVQILLDGKPSGMRFLKEKMVVDLNLTQENGIAIRVAAYQNTRPPVLAKVAAGPFEDTEKVLKFYPRPNPAMQFQEGENLRLAVRQSHLVPLARNESDLGSAIDQLRKAEADPAFHILEPWPTPIVPMGTKGKIVRVADSAYEIEIAEGRYRHWRLFAKKEWAYPVDDAQAQKKAAELAALQPAKPTIAQDRKVKPEAIDEDARKAKEAEESRASQKLAEAKTLLKAGKREQAVEKLERLTIEHPDTPAAKEAKDLLRDLKK
jgi:hypothetical protein